MCNPDQGGDVRFEANGGFDYIPRNSSLLYFLSQNPLDFAFPERFSLLCKPPDIIDWITPIVYLVDICISYRDKTHYRNNLDDAEGRGFA